MLSRTAAGLPLRAAVQETTVGSHLVGSCNRGRRGIKKMPNHSLERTRPRRRDTPNVSWPGRSARGRYAPADNG